MFEQTAKTIGDILHKDAGDSSELDFTVAIRQSTPVGWVHT